MTHVGGVFLGDNDLASRTAFTGVTSLKLPPTVTTLSQINNLAVTEFTIPKSVKTLNFCQKSEDEPAFSCDHVNYNYGAYPMITSTKPWNLTIEEGSAIDSLGFYVFSAEYYNGDSPRASAANLQRINLSSSVRSLDRTVFVNNGGEDTSRYVQVYTADASNPAGLTNSKTADSDYRRGGHLINPAQITLKFVDENGADLAPSRTVISSDPKIKDYLVKSNDGATAEAIFAKYYYAGSEYSYAPSAIDNYETPAEQTVKLRPGENILTFVYKKPAANGNATSAPAANILAETGMNATAVALVSGMSFIGAVLLFRRRAQS